MNNGVKFDEKDLKTSNNNFDTYESVKSLFEESQDYIQKLLIPFDLNIINYESIIVNLPIKKYLTTSFSLFSKFSKNNEIFCKNLNDLQKKLHEFLIIKNKNYKFKILNEEFNQLSTNDELFTYKGKILYLKIKNTTITNLKSVEIDQKKNFSDNKKFVLSKKLMKLDFNSESSVPNTQTNYKFYNLTKSKKTKQNSERAPVFNNGLVNSNIHKFEQNLKITNKTITLSNSFKEPNFLNKTGKNLSRLTNCKGEQDSSNRENLNPVLNSKLGLTSVDQIFKSFVCNEEKIIKKIKVSLTKRLGLNINDNYVQIQNTEINRNNNLVQEIRKNRSKLKALEVNFENVENNLLTRIISKENLLILDNKETNVETQTCLNNKEKSRFFRKIIRKLSKFILEVLSNYNEVEDKIRKLFPIGYYHLNEYKLLPISLYQKELLFFSYLSKATNFSNSFEEFFSHEESAQDLFQRIECILNDNLSKFSDFVEEKSQNSLILLDVEFFKLFVSFKNTDKSTSLNYVEIICKSLGMVQHVNIDQFLEFKRLFYHEVEFISILVFLKKLLNVLKNEYFSTQLEFDFRQKFELDDRLSSLILRLDIIQAKKLNQEKIKKISNCFGLIKSFIL